MESTTFVHGVSFRETPRDGQRKVYDLAAELNCLSISPHIPTGYGKTRLAFGIYSILRHQGRANRMLFIVGTQQQRDQFRIDGPSDACEVGLDIKQVVDIGFNHVTALDKHRRGVAEVFVTTVQSILERNIGSSVVMELMQIGRWMITVDECHHYGEGKKFADAVRRLPGVFLFAPSATPSRKYRDGIFGIPFPIVKYIDAVHEGALKAMHLHSYIYRVDTIGPDGGISSYTTDELAAFFGIEPGPNGELTGLDKAMIARNLRWSPKYVSPLVDKPIQRALETALATGVPAQVLIKAMSISHAKLIYAQINAMYKDTPIVVEWVGTGDDGRTEEENKRILAGFCPPKRNGKRRPEDVKVNVLVAVGLAGEGMDSTFVTEVVFLTPGNDTNENRQTMGRGSRSIWGLPKQPRCNVNVDSSSPLAKYKGAAVMELLDMPVGEESVIEPSDEDEEPPIGPPLPVEPMFLVLNAELLRIDDSDVRRAGAYAQQMKLLPYSVPNNDWSKVSPDDPVFQHVLKGLRKATDQEAEQMNEQSMVERWHNAVKLATQKCAGTANTLMNRNGHRIDQTLVGDIKKRINQQKARQAGMLVKDVAVLKRHYQWLVQLDTALREGMLPSWLE